MKYGDRGLSSVRIKLLELVRAVVAASRLQARRSVTSIQVYQDYDFSQHIGGSLKCPRWSALQLIVELGFVSQALRLLL